MSGGRSVVSVYDGAAEGWASGATLVYAPLARALVARAPHSLAGRRVLDVGAGTGVGSDALRSAGACPVALDRSWDMLALGSDRRAPCVVADVDAVPLRAGVVDDVFASFVLNHVRRPVDALVELARTVGEGGTVLASSFSSTSASPVRDRVDAVAVAHGWRAPDWYVEMKASVVPLLGSAAAMEAVASAAGLQEVAVEEVAMDVGVHEPDALVRYRLGQAQFAPYLAALAPDEEAELRGAAVAAITPVMEPYRPRVVFLTALVG